MARFLIQAQEGHFGATPAEDITCYHAIVKVTKSKKLADEWLEAKLAEMRNQRRELEANDIELVWKCPVLKQSDVWPWPEPEHSPESDVIKHLSTQIENPESTIRNWIQANCRTEKEDPDHKRKKFVSKEKLLQLLNAKGFVTEVDSPE